MKSECEVSEFWMTHIFQLHICGCNFTLCAAIWAYVTFEFILWYLWYIELNLNLIKRGRRVKKYNT